MTLHTRTNNECPRRYVHRCGTQRIKHTKGHLSLSCFGRVKFSGFRISKTSANKRLLQYVLLFYVGERRVIYSPSEWVILILRFLCARTLSCVQWKAIPIGTLTRRDWYQHLSWCILPSLVRLQNKAIYQ